MQGVHSLQDLKSKLALAGFEVLESHGWYLDSAHGRWTMSFGVVYLEGNAINNIADVKVKKKPASKKTNGLVKKKIKSKKSK